jgi:hypothetical protein
MDALLITVHLVVDIAFFYWHGKYATGWALVRRTFDWGVLDEKRTHPNTNIGRSKWDFGPTNVRLCHKCVGAVNYVETEA